MTIYKTETSDSNISLCPRTHSPIKQWRFNRRDSRGGILVEVMMTLLLFMSTSAYLLSSQISSRVLWQTILDTQVNQTAVINSARMDNASDDIDQNWSDIAVFGLPILVSTSP